MSRYYVGLMSGTSLDGIDAALVEIEDNQVGLLATSFQPFPQAFRAALKTICFTDEARIKLLGTLDIRLGVLFAQSVQKLLRDTGFDPGRITAIGCSGQTVYHSPESNPPFSIQLGDPNHLAEDTGITTVADFRRRDIAAGGQGAPLVPAFHQAVFACGRENRVVANIGGIANITVLPRNNASRILGFDTGPGNTLLDLWASRQRGKTFDQDGQLGRSGTANPALLQSMLNDPYFHRDPPKSTGQEYFSENWVTEKIAASKSGIKPADIQATLYLLTVFSIAEAIRRYAPDTERALICGGGALNSYLLELLGAQLPFPVESTAHHGIDPEWVEAAAFAWLAHRTLHNQAGNLPSVTGANHPVVLGGIYPGRQAIA